MNLSDLTTPGGGIGGLSAPNAFSPLLNNLNLKNLNANIQRIIAAKNVLGTGLLNMTPSANQSSVQSENNSNGPVITEVP